MSFTVLERYQVHTPICTRTYGLGFSQSDRRILCVSILYYTIIGNTGSKSCSSAYDSNMDQANNVTRVFTKLPISARLTNKFPNVNDNGQYR